MFWGYFLYKDAIRVLKKNNVDVDNMSAKNRKELIEILSTR